jgi:hypothetical protein
LAPAALTAPERAETRACPEPIWRCRSAVLVGDAGAEAEPAARAV